MSAYAGGFAVWDLPAAEEDEAYQGYADVVSEIDIPDSANGVVLNWLKNSPRLDVASHISRQWQACHSAVNAMTISNTPIQPFGKQYVSKRQTSTKHDEDQAQSINSSPTPE